MVPDVVPSSAPLGARCARARVHHISSDPAKLIARHFLTIGISIDTLDPVQAETIGRHSLAKVLANLDALLQLMEPQRIVIMTVDMGQPLDALHNWVKEQGFARHIVQPLMQKQDYSQRYPQKAPQPLPLASAQTCRFVQQDTMRFYTREGQALPCCFIKNTQGIASIAALRGLLQAGEPPPGCLGCKELHRVAPNLIENPNEGAAHAAH